MLCSKCSANVPDGVRFCSVCGTPVASTVAVGAATATAHTTSSAGADFDFSSNGASAPAKDRKFYQYKVLSQKDKWLSGKFDPIMLEQALNAYAQQGWRVIGCATADIPGFGAARQEFITVLEREV